MYGLALQHAEHHLVQLSQIQLEGEPAVQVPQLVEQVPVPQAVGEAVLEQHAEGQLDERVHA